MSFLKQCTIVVTLLCLVVAFGGCGNVEPIESLRIESLELKVASLLDIVKAMNESTTVAEIGAAAFEVNRLQGSTNKALLDATRANRERIAFIDNHVENLDETMALSSDMHNVFLDALRGINERLTVLEDSVAR